MTYAKTGAEAPPMPRKKKRRIFVWFFLAVQILFLTWIIAVIRADASGQGAQANGQAVSFCSANWQGLYNSDADCVSNYGNDLSGASDTSTAIGAGFVIALWVAADVILGVSYGVYRLATRENR